MTDVLRRPGFFASASLIDQSNRLEREQLAQLISALGVVSPPSLVLVGAAARDIWLDEFQVPIVRATTDSDFAFAVESWEQFRALRESLLKVEGFAATRVEHKVTFRGQRVDLVPFGGIERSDRTIAWPNDEPVMNAIGLREAARTATEVQLPGEVFVPVASLPAMAVLKICAWADRKNRTERDAGDFWSLLTAWIASVDDRIFGPALDVYESLEFDFDLTAAWLWGSDARGLLATDAQAIRHIDETLKAEVDVDGPLRFVSGPNFSNPNRRLRCLEAFRAGLADPR